MSKPACKQIVVTVLGGVVQSVEGVPHGYELVVHDYDVEGCDESELPIDANGDHYEEQTP